MSRSLWAPFLIVDADAETRDALVVIDGDRIVAVEVGVARDAALQRGAEPFDGCVIAPGFVNAHAHIEYASYEGLADGLEFADWIYDHVQRKRRLEPAHMRASAVLGAWQCAAGGITTVADASYSGDAAFALDEVGLRGRVYLEVLSHRHAADLVDARRTLEALPRSPLLEHGLSPHAPYTATRALYEAVAGSGLPWMTHVAETAMEVQYTRTGTGPVADGVRALRGGVDEIPWNGRPIEVLGDLLGSDAVLVHAVHAATHELELVASSGAGIAHCPRSNALLGCGVFDFPAAQRRGATVALGTDSPASAGPLDMFAEMRTMLEVHRAARGAATAPTAHDALRACTTDAARVLGLADRVGRIAVGLQADLVVCALDPGDSARTSYVLQARPADVRETVVAGRLVWSHDMNALIRARELARETRALLRAPVAPAAKTGSQPASSDDARRTR